MSAAAPSGPISCTLVGGGMITNDQLLPSLYHLQRKGVLSDIAICALNSAPLRALAESPTLRDAFPGQSFKAYPELTEDPKKMHPDLFRDVVSRMAPGNLVVVAVPDHAHGPIIRQALEHGQHVLTVKPLVLKHAEATEIEKMAHERGLFVGVEYHKRFDRRALEARASYQSGRFGAFRCGEAKLIEPWAYRHSNFQNWFTKENTDPFTYIGCHYVDLTYFITGLRPTEVSVVGVPGTFPNGNEGYMWSSARVTFENGALLSVVNGMGYPDEGAGSNDQAMCLYCEGKDGGGLIHHFDQFRGVSHSYVDGKDPHPFRFINPDYMRLVAWEGKGKKAVGYGYDSIEASVLSVQRLREASTGQLADAALTRRKAILDEIDATGIIATPKNSAVNELVLEAGRLSITNSGRAVGINHGDHPSVALR